MTERWVEAFTDCISGAPLGYTPQDFVSSGSLYHGRQCGTVTCCKDEVPFRMPADVSVLNVVGPLAARAVSLGIESAGARRGDRDVLCVGPWQVALNLPVHVVVRSVRERR